MNRPSGWYRTTAETTSPGGVVGSIYRWWDNERERWTQYVDEWPGQTPLEFRRRIAGPEVPTEAIKLPRTGQIKTP